MTNNQSTSKWRLLLPMHWPLWWLFGMMRLSVWLPYPWAMRLGQGLGTLAWQICRGIQHPRVHIVRTNLRLCFPKLGHQALSQLEQRCWHAMGMGLMETALAWWGATAKIKRLFVEVIGFQHVTKALEQKRAIQIQYAHYTTMELGGRWIAEHTAIHATSKRYHNPLSHWMIIRKRLGYLQRVIFPEQFKQTVRLLQNNQAVAFMMDLDFGHRNTVFDHFMGMPCSTSILGAKLARQYPSAVIPMRSYRLPNNRGYGVKFEAPLAKAVWEDDQCFARTINAFIEANLRDHPEQYLWLHRRFKTQPDERTLYEKV